MKPPSKTPTNAELSQSIKELFGGPAAKEGLMSGAHQLIGAMLGAATTPGLGNDKGLLGLGYRWLVGVTIDAMTKAGAEGKRVQVIIDGKTVLDMNAPEKTKTTP